MWVRSQNKEVLINANRIVIEEKDNSILEEIGNGDALILGKYSTIEKAMKVMNMLEEHILYLEFLKHKIPDSISWVVFQFPTDTEVD